MHKVTSAITAILYCVIFISLCACQEEYEVPAVEPMKQRIENLEEEDPKPVPRNMWYSFIKLDKRPPQELAMITPEIMQMYAEKLYETIDNKAKCFGDGGACLVAAMYVPAKKIIYASTVPTGRYKRIMNNNPQAAPYWTAAIGNPIVPTQPNNRHPFHAEDGCYFMFESAVNRNELIKNNKYPAGTVLGVYGQYSSTDEEKPRSPCGSTSQQKRFPSCVEVAEKLGVVWRTKNTEKDPPEEDGGAGNIEFDEEILAAPDLPCEEPRENPLHDQKNIAATHPKQSNSTVKRSGPRKHARAINKLVNACISFPTPEVGAYEENPTATAESEIGFDLGETPITTQLTPATQPPPTPKIQASLGNSKVPCGTATSSDLYTSLSNALETLCPTPTTVGAWTSCKNDSQVALSHIEFPGSDGAKREDGELVIRVPNSKYNITEARDSLIKATALAAQNQTGTMCYNMTYDLFGKRSNTPTTYTPVHSKRFPPIPTHLLMCDILGFVGIEYFSPWWREEDEPGSTYNLFMTSTFQIASENDDFDVCALLEAIDGILLLVAPEFAFGEIGAAEVLEGVCSVDEDE